MTDQYALIGNPISDATSPLIHSAFAEQTGQELTCTAIESALDGFREAVDAFRSAGGRGVNVTAPFKREAFNYATELSEEARLAGTVNCLKFAGENIYAGNFEGIALVRDIEHKLGVPIGGKKILLLGAGAAARAAIQPILAQQPGELLIVNRSVSKAHALVEAFSGYGELSASTYPDLGASLHSFDVVINATSASLRGELPPLHTGVFSPHGVAYELTYGRGLTPFLRLAQASGARRLADGTGMLVEQAAEAFAWWRGVRPDTRHLIETLAVALK